MLYYHGIALESHAQNMMLIHEDGWPTRVAIKDFHDGVRFKRGLLSTEAQNPQLKDTPEEHKKINRNSFIETEDVELVRDFTLDAFFFINISEIIMFFERHYNLSEHKQWMYVYDEIKQYRQTHPDLPNYEQFLICFEKTIQVEKLTTRRLLEDTEIRIHHVTNPLGSVFIMMTLSLKDKLAQDTEVYGIFNSIPNPLVIELIAASGYDFVIEVDTEHAAINDETLEHLIRAAEAAQITPIVRVTQVIDRDIIKVLDMGARGIIIPHVKDKATVEHIVELSRYYPQGMRSLNGGRMAKFGEIPLTDYMTMQKPQNYCHGDD